MKKLLVLIAAVGISLSAAAQNYNHGIGLRFGHSSGFDFKWNHAPTRSWEFNLSFPHFFDGVSASAAYQWNWPIGPQGYNGEGFNAYAGPSATVGLYNFKNGGGMFGVGGWGGIEYKFKIPLAVAADWRPTLTFISTDNTIDYWGFWDFGIAVRYTF